MRSSASMPRNPLWPGQLRRMGAVPPRTCSRLSRAAIGKRSRESSSSRPSGVVKFRYTYGANSGKKGVAGLYMSKAILYDSTLCIGCKACEGACAARWGLPYDEKIAAEEHLSAHKLTAIESHGERYSRRLCMHCEQPTCASVCPVGALQKTALGPVLYDAS